MSEAIANQALPIGAMIEEFRIVAILGTGSFGVVYQCDNTYLDESVAIKEFLPVDLAKRQPDGRIAPLSPATNDAFSWALDRFLQEAKTLWGLGRPIPHRNIVRVTRYRELSGSAYMFMEFERGQPLSALLEECGALPLQKLRAILEPLLDGLEKVHSSGILHRDIKPANILIRSDGSPVLIDFGSARYVTQSGERSVFATYTPLYAALEQHQDIGEQGPWTDIYGLGATLYRVVTGTPPRSASQRLLSDPQPPAAEVCRGDYPAAFLEAIDLACELEPAKRPQSVAQWRDLLLGPRSADIYAPTVVRTTTGGRRRRVARESEAPGQTAATPQQAEVSAGTSTPSAFPDESGGRGGRSRVTGIVTGVLIFAVGVLIGWYLLVRDPTGGTAPMVDIELPAPQDDRPSTATNYEQIAIAHFQRSEIEQSIDLVELGLAATPKDQRLNELREYFNSHKRAQDLLDQAQNAVERGDLERSLALIDDGLEELPEHRELLSLRQRVNQLMIARLQTQVDSLLERAETAQANGNLDASLALIDDGLHLDANNRKLLALRATVRAQVQRDRQVATAKAEARTLISQGAFDAGLERISDAMAIAPNDEELGQLQKELELARQQERETWVAKQLESAGRAEADGNDTQSLALIDKALAEEPDHPRLLSFRNTLLAAMNRQRVEQLLDSARERLGRDNLEQALGFIDEALGLSPADSALIQMRSDVEARLKQRGQIERAIAEAREFQRAQAFTKSLARIEEGLQIASDNQELLGLRAAVQSELQQKRERDAADLLAQAHDEQAAGNLKQAIALTEQALMLSPDDVLIDNYRRELKAALDRRQELDRIAKECASFPEPQTPDPDQLAQAAVCFGRMLKLDANDQRARDGLRRIGNAYALLTAEALAASDAAAADQALSALRQLQPDHPRLADLDRDRDLMQRQLLPVMVAVKGGCFSMGSPPDEIGREPDEAQHEVCVDDFLIGKFEVTVEDFERFVDDTDYRTDAERGVGGQLGCWTFDGENGGEKWAYRQWAQWRKPTKHVANQPKSPVSCISWNDASAYIGWLKNETGRKFRLPTEAEWEYAARAGTSSARYWGDGIDHEACRNASVADTEHEWKDGFRCDDTYEWVATVGRFAPNPWGLHDVLGNLWEWTCSNYDADYRGTEEVCAKVTSDAARVMRGGAWNSGPSPVRSAYRNRNFPEARYSFVGFRLAQDAPVTD